MPGQRDVGEDPQVQLTRMEGKIDRIDDRMAAMKEDMGEMRQAHADLSRRTDERLHAHGNRIQVLEAKNLIQDGERRGVRKTVTVAWALSGLGGGGLVTALAVHFLHLA